MGFVSELSATRHIWNSVPDCSLCLADYLLDPLWSHDEKGVSSTVRLVSFTGRTSLEALELLIGSL